VERLTVGKVKVSMSKISPKARAWRRFGWLAVAAVVWGCGSGGNLPKPVAQTEPAPDAGPDLSITVKNDEKPVQAIPAVSPTPPPPKKHRHHKPKVEKPVEIVPNPDDETKTTPDSNPPTDSGGDKPTPPDNTGGDGGGTTGGGGGTGTDGGGGTDAGGQAGN
jgi:hypothetical protein